MARLASILIPVTTTGAGAGPSDYVVSLVTTAAQNFLLGNNAIFVINSGAAVSISFYSSKGTAFPASPTTCYSIPANQQTTFDLGQANDTISICNTATGTNTAYIKLLSVV
jgi:hypothetical protein